MSGQIIDEHHRQIRSTLYEIAELLETHGQQIPHVDAIRGALYGSETDLDQFIISNRLWGGAGSIADSGIVGQTKEERTSMQEPRKAFRDLMIQLGRLQMELHATNPRTAIWVNAFEEWQRNGIE